MVIIMRFRVSFLLCLLYVWYKFIKSEIAMGGIYDGEF